MGRNSAAKNGLAPPIWVRLPFLQDYQLRRIAGDDCEIGAVARQLICEALKTRELARDLAARNKARLARL